ncbi:MAG TPA: peptidylprolyl isomerase, partial [Anaerolineaceae bacterium]|nr:peptidylprolyl isomerase [Anaerolineaceae bacterium]
PTPTPQPFEMFCSLVSQPPDPSLEPASLFPLPSAQDWSAGPEDAVFTVIEYADFRSTLTTDAAVVLRKLSLDYPAQFRLILRYLPDALEPRSLLAAQAAEAAGLQGQFWVMHDHLLSRQAEWLELDQAALETWLAEQAGQIGLDAERFAADLTSAPVIRNVLESQQQAAALGIPNPLLLLINGQIYQGSLDYTSLEAMLRLFDFQSRQFSECPPTVIDQKRTYRAILETEKGEVVLELFPAQSPLAVNNFVFLAQRGWYDNTTFHWVLPGYLVQGGDPSGTGYGNAGYAFSNEFDPQLSFDQSGMLAMADGSNSNSSQFFINLSPQPDWNGRYTIFGRVLEGMDVLQAFTLRDPSSQFNPPPGDRLIRVTIQEGD